MDEIDRLLVENWRNKRLATGTSPGTINRNVVVIRSVLSKAVEWGLLKHHPLTGLKKLRVDRGGAPRMLSDEDRKKLFAALAERDRILADERRSANRWRQERHYPLLPELTHYGDHLTPIVMTAYFTGMRRGEVFSLQWDNIDLDNRVLTVRGDNTRYENAGIQTTLFKGALLGLLFRFPVVSVAYFRTTGLTGRGDRREVF